MVPRNRTSIYTNSNNEVIISVNDNAAVYNWDLTMEMAILALARDYMESDHGKFHYKSYTTPGGELYGSRSRDYFRLKAALNRLDKTQEELSDMKYGMSDNRDTFRYNQAIAALFELRHYMWY